MLYSDQDYAICSNCSMENYKVIALALYDLHGRRLKGDWEKRSSRILGGK